MSPAIEEALETVSNLDHGVLVIIPSKEAP